MRVDTTTVALLLAAAGLSVVYLRCGAVRQFQRPVPQQPPDSPAAARDQEPPQPKPEPGAEPEPEPEPEAELQGTEVGAEAEACVNRIRLLQSWRRTSIGKGGQVRWVPQHAAAQHEENAAESDTSDVSALDSAELARVSELIEQAHRVCPLVPIHTSRRGGLETSHELVLLRRAGVQRTHRQAAALALQTNYAARAALLQLCGEINPTGACASLLVKIQEQQAALEALQSLPLPRPMAEFDETWRSERVVHFSTSKHNLYAMVSEIVMMGWGPHSDERSRDSLSGCPDLSRLHTFPQNPQRSPSCPAVLMEFKLADPTAPWSPPTEWGTSWVNGVRGMHDTASPAGWFNVYRKRGRNQHTAEFRKSHEFRAFLKVYRKFVADVVVPLVGDPRGVLFQCPPTLRVVLPSDHAVGKLHKDGDYGGHEESEINFWCPITDVSGTNTLYLESEPGRGDYRPVEMRYGEVLRFDGLNCMHHTVPNTSDTCRVSFDFRVIPRSFWRDDFAQRTGSYDLELAV